MKKCYWCGGDMLYDDILGIECCEKCGIEY